MTTKQTMGGPNKKFVRFSLYLPPDMHADIVEISKQRIGFCSINSLILEAIDRWRIRQGKKEK